MLGQETVVDCVRLVQSTVNPFLQQNKVRVWIFNTWLNLLCLHGLLLQTRNRFAIAGALVLLCCWTSVCLFCGRQFYLVLSVTRLISVCRWKTT